MTHYLYVFTMMGYGRPAEYPTKIGITKNLAQRERQLWYSYGGLVPKLVAHVEFPDRASARCVELSLIRHFPKADPTSKELLKARPSEIIAFLQSQCPSPDSVQVHHG